MNEYIVTTYSHHDAIQIMRLLKSHGISVTLCPVPREISSSCGTCARFFAEADPAPLLDKIEFERLVQIMGAKLHTLLDRR